MQTAHDASDLNTQPLPGARVIAVANQKGGVGKTTTAVNLAASLAASNHPTLLVDMDPQGNASASCGIDKTQLEMGVCEVLLGEVEIEQAIEKEGSAQCHLLPTNGDLTAAEVSLLSLEDKEFRLKRAFAKISHNYEYIIIDCPPSLNMLTLNALVASDRVLIPMQCEYYALEGLSALVGTIEQIRSTVNENLLIEGVLRTMYDPRNSLTREVAAQLQEFFGEKLYRTVIPRNVRLAEAPSFGQPILSYDKNSKGAVAYLTLAGELIRRREEEKKLAQVPGEQVFNEAPHQKPVQTEAEAC